MAAPGALDQRRSFGLGGKLGVLIRRLIRPLARHGTAAFGVAILGMLMAAAVFAQIVSPFEPNAPHLADRLAPPGSGQYALGTDLQGRDILSRLIWGARPSLTMTLSSLGISGAIGIAAGSIAAFRGGTTATILMRSTDVFFGLPPVLLAILVAASLGAGLGSMIAAMSIVMIPPMVRVAYQSALIVKSLSFVEAARAAGASDWRILLDQIAPNILTPVIAYGASLSGQVIVFGAGLSFVGLGIQPPDADWGRMINDGRLVLSSAPHVATLPGLAIFAAALGFNLIGDALRDALDPRLRL